jgi:Sulfotransferase family
MVGALEAVEANLDEVIAARPGDGEAYSARSDLRKQTRERNHIRQLKAVLSQLKGRRVSVAVGFALAKELEDVGDYARSFNYLRTACDAYRAALQYDVADDISVLDKLRKTHTANALQALRTSNDIRECIFVLGLPRSGTTLVERILGSHGEVYSAGELDAFPRVAVEAVAQREGKTVSKLEFVDRVLGVNF